MTGGSTVAAVVLAAGASSRLGRPKQTLQYENTSLLRRALLAAIDSGCSPVLVVTGANAAAARLELEGLDVREIFNLSWDSGIGSSIAAGIEELTRAAPNVSAAVIMLCDQPFVTADVISRITSVYRSNLNSIVASRYGSDFGVPALFDTSLFAELAELDGAVGAKAVISKHLSQAGFIPFPEGEIDIDTPDDYMMLVSGGLKSSG